MALYARSFAIELGVRMLKAQLGLRFLWSATMQVIGAQLWASVILAHILHALQVQVAIESGVETFDVSLELLWRSSFPIVCALGHPMNCAPTALPSYFIKGVVMESGF